LFFTIKSWLVFVSAGSLVVWDFKSITWALVGIGGPAGFDGESAGGGTRLVSGAGLELSAGWPVGSAPGFGGKKSVLLVLMSFFKTSPYKIK
jgi:hypothetical protein